MDTILFVDGETLKKHIIEAGQPYGAQSIIKFLYNAVSEIKQNHPRADVSIHYYGSRPICDAQWPISKKAYLEKDMKSELYKKGVPNAKSFETDWGRSQKMDYGKWIMKPESLEKKPKDLRDNDFELQVQKKGVTTKLVDHMAETAVKGQVKKIFVLGDSKDLAYAAKVTTALGVDVDWIEFNGNRPKIEASFEAQEPKLSSIEELKKIQDKINSIQPEQLPEVLSQMRQNNPIKRNILMIDMGLMSAYLHSKKIKLTEKNLSLLLGKVLEKINTQDLEIICYTSSKMHSKVKNPKRQSRVFLLSEVPNEMPKKSIISQGTIQQKEPYYTILKERKWKVPHSERKATDFDANIQQYDVDDRIAYDMALARFDSSIDTVHLLSRDTDFMQGVEQMKNAGVCVELLDISNTRVPKQLFENVTGVYSFAIDDKKLCEEAVGPIPKESENKRRHNKSKQTENKLFKKKAGLLKYEAADLLDEEKDFVYIRKPTKQERSATLRLRQKSKMKGNDRD